MMGTGRPARLVRALLACIVLASVTAGASQAAASVSLPTIERQVMCVTCKIPLNVAQSPQANREREYIRTLIAEGHDESEIKNALVVQYTSAVLGLPQTHGFDLAAYLVPIAVVVGLLALLAFLLPSWRRRSGAGPPESSCTISSEESARLESDLARFD
jgi:cytochrome c-type biogenesis protein CcmH/NrfF